MITKEQNIWWAHFGIGAGNLIIAASSLAGWIPGWGAVAGAVAATAAHAISGQILSTMQKNVDPRFE